MSLVIEISTLLLFCWVVSQLGSRIPGSAAVIWLGASVLLVIAAFFPNELKPIATALGISFVSNLVLAGFIVFLFVTSLTLTTSSLSMQRQIRNLVSEDAARAFRIPPDKSTKQSNKCLVIVPCFNESAIIATTISKLKAAQLSAEDSHPFDFCIVDDGSLDGTREKLLEHAAGYSIFHTSNVGVAAVLATGFRVAIRNNYQFVCQCDADGQHPIEMIPFLLAEAQSNEDDLLIGSRFVSSGNPNDHSNSAESTTLTRRFGSKMISMVLGLFWRNVRVYDPTSGFRIYSKKAFNHLLSAMPDEYPEPESVAILASRNFKIREIKIKMIARQTGQSSLAGIASIRFMIKVMASLLGLRIRLFFEKQSNRS